MSAKDMSIKPAAVPASSIVLRGVDARTFSEMESFVKDLESRPVERLLRDLHHLVALSATKASLVSYVIAGKFKQANPVERNVMRESIADTIERLTDDEARERAVGILERLR